MGMRKLLHNPIKTECYWETTDPRREKILSLTLGSIVLPCLNSSCNLEILFSSYKTEQIVAEKEGKILEQFCIDANVKAVKNWCFYLDE